jgi:uncharacterized DUF497 family protein
MKIEFDPDKNDRNIRERGLSFERVAEFDFDTAVVAVDARRDYPEVRYVALGMLDARLHVLVFSEIAGGIRVISFRKGNDREVKRYEQARSND